MPLYQVPKKDLLDKIQELEAKIATAEANLVGPKNRLAQYKKARQVLIDNDT